MKNCLVTTLNGSVNNEDLLKLGEIKLKVGKSYASASYGTVAIYFYDTAEKIHVEALEGSFKETPTGTPITSIDALPSGAATYKNLYIDQDTVLSISNKYNISGLGGAYYLYKVYGYGDVIKAANTIPHFNRFTNDYCDKFGNVNNSKIDISILDTNFILNGNTQNIEDVASKFPHVELLRVRNLSGNISSIAGISTLKEFAVYDENLEGDVALLNVEKFTDTMTNVAYMNFSWSSRPSTKNVIIGDLFLASADDRKRMLIDNSNCVRSDTSTTAILRTLAVDTSDSDVAAALTRLRAKNIEVRRENNTVLN